MPAGWAAETDENLATALAVLDDIARAQRDAEKQARRKG